MQSEQCEKLGLCKFKEFRFSQLQFMGCLQIAYPLLTKLDLSSLTHIDDYWLYSVLGLRRGNIGVKNLKREGEVRKGGELAA